MPTHSPTRRRYDHRFRQLVHSTGDLQLALDKGVPRSTATSWLRTPSSEVVTLDLAEMSEAELRREVAALRRRNERLAAVLRLLIVMLKVAGVSLVRSRIVEGSNKDLLLRAVERSRKHLSLRAALRILRLSSSRYHAWRRDGTCGLDDVSSCPRTSPQQLTVEEGREVRTMATSEDVSTRSDRHVSSSRSAPWPGVRIPGNVVPARSTTSLETTASACSSGEAEDRNPCFQAERVLACGYDGDPPPRRNSQLCSYGDRQLLTEDPCMASRRPFRSRQRACSPLRSDTPDRRDR